METEAPESSPQGEASGVKVESVESSPHGEASATVDDPSVSAFEPVGSQGRTVTDCNGARSACPEGGWRLTLRVLKTPLPSATKC